jgi:cell fate (sporulation/competence/biofilm development) regulator YlbF (YheA/YmcA/DUF963 family)
MINSLDINELVDAAHELGTQINQSNQVAQYLKLKQKVQNDAEAQFMLKAFQKVKEEFEETKRFGIFHPNFHEAKEKMASFQEQLNNHPLIGEYLQAEETVEQLLYQVSYVVARSVSDEVKVPNELTGKKRRKSQPIQKEIGK